MHLKLRAMYLHLQAFCKASSGFRLQLFALKMFHSLKSVTWLASHIKSMPKMCSSCLQHAGKGVWTILENSVTYVHMLDLLTISLHYQFSFCEKL